MNKKAYEKMVKTILTNGTLDKRYLPYLRVYRHGDMELSITQRFVAIYKNVRVQGCYRQESILRCDLKDGFIF